LNTNEKFGEKQRQEYLRLHGPKDVDFCFLLTRLYAKDTGQIFRVNVPDSVVFTSADPVMRVCTAKSSDMLLEIVTDKDKLSLNEIHAFFSQRNAEEYKLAEEEHFLSIPKSEREPQRKPNFSSILITWNFETTNSYGNIETSKRILMEDKLTYLFNNTSKTNASWQNLQLLTRVLVGRKGEFKYNFDADEHIHCQDPVVADIVSAARRALLSFAKVLPRSAKGYISNEDDLAYQEVSFYLCYLTCTDPF
jgi:hypothetical protein